MSTDGHGRARLTASARGEPPAHNGSPRAVPARRRLSRREKVPGRPALGLSAQRPKGRVAVRPAARQGTPWSASVHVQDAAVLWPLLGRGLLRGSVVLLLLLRRLLLLLLSGGLGLRLLQDLVGKLRELQVFLLHVRAEENGLFMFRKCCLLSLQVREPLRNTIALLRNLAQLVRGNVIVLLTGILPCRLVVGDCAREGLNPLAADLALLAPPYHGVAHLLELVELVNVHDLGSVLCVVEPVLHLGEVRHEGLTIGVSDECAVLSTLSAPVTHGEYVRLQVVPLRVCFDDLCHLRLHSALLVHQLLQHHLAQARDVAGDDGDVGLLGAPLLLDNIDPLVLLLVLLGLFLIALLLLLLALALALRLGLRRLLLGRLGLLGLRFLRRHLDLALLLDRLIVLLLLNELCALDREHGIEVELGLHLDLLGFTLRWQVNLVRAQLLLGAWDETGLVRILSLDLEGPLPVKGQELECVKR
mmetsp:Transcript_67516/g.191349  ORF Transcript_67516/g.191349 Transcript_67516/m.191349 type:complete len:474 (-) Transcript_67516:1386-2807(-)